MQVSNDIKHFKWFDADRSGSSAEESEPLKSEDHRHFWANLQDLSILIKKKKKQHVVNCLINTGYSSSIMYSTVHIKVSMWTVYFWTQ